MSLLSPKDRLDRVLKKEKTDRPPVICTGGMMNAAIVDVMNKTGHTLPEAHNDAELMAELAYDVFENTGFENLGIPFCMTVEAEVLGSEIDFGSLSCEPKIEKEAFPSVTRVVFKDIEKMMNLGRIGTIVKACYHLVRKNPDIPVIGNLSGPISLSASIVDPMIFLREIRKDREGAHRVLNYVSNFLIQYAKLMVDNGARVISIGDPTATGEILGPRMFEEYAIRYLNKIIDAIRAHGAHVIVHICGNMNKVRPLLQQIRSDAISTDAMVNLVQLKRDFPDLTTMGNLSTYLLEFGHPDKVARQTVNLVHDGVDIISPACGLSTSTSLENIRAMTGVVKNY